jgi:hypothetical protein
MSSGRLAETSVTRAGAGRTRGDGVADGNNCGNADPGLLSGFGSAGTPAWAAPTPLPLIVPGGSVPPSPTLVVGLLVVGEGLGDGDGDAGSTRNFTVEVAGVGAPGGVPVAPTVKWILVLPVLLGIGICAWSS